MNVCMIANLSTFPLVNSMRNLLPQVISCLCILLKDSLSNQNLNSADHAVVIVAIICDNTWESWKLPLRILCSVGGLSDIIIFDHVIILGIFALKD